MVKHITKNYLPWIGILQALAITLVVLGHSLPIDDIAKNPVFIQGIRNVIYSFHIPLFFSISGYLFWYTQSKKKIGYSKFIYKKLIQLILPYIVIGILMFIPRYLLNTYSNNPIELSMSTLVRTFLYPLEHTVRFYWYLPTLFLMFVIAPLFEKIVESKKIIFITFLVLSFLSMYRIHIFLLNINGLSNYLIYFYTGILLCFYKEKVVGLFKNKILISILFFAFALGNYFFWTTDSNLGRIYYVCEYILAILGILISFSLVFLYEDPLRFFLYITPYTFMIYLWSFFPQVIIKILFEKGYINYWIAVIGMFVFGMAVPMVLGNLQKKIFSRD